MNTEKAVELALLTRSLLQSQPLSPEKKEMVRQATEYLKKSPPPWIPWEGPQTAAYQTQADELYFGGSSGGGKTSLGVGLSLTCHRRSLILRRQSIQVPEIVEQLQRFAPGARWRGAGYGGVMNTKDGRMIEVGGCDEEKEKEKYAGRPHDLIVYDEGPRFSRSQALFISAWNRHEDPKQRCRIIFPGNPPTRAEDRWIIQEFAPWLEATYPKPARPGELRWYTVIDGKTQWFDTGDPIVNGGERIMPRSRTFIPSRLSDNPILSSTNYEAVLQALPEPLRSQLLYGDMNAGTDDDAWQVIPTAWVQAAQSRWTVAPPAGQPLTRIGVDAAYGGADATTVAPRYGNWFGEVKKYQGSITDSGQKAAYLVLKEYRDDAEVWVDGIGYGAACVEFLREKIGKRVVAVNVANTTEVYDRSGKYRLTNVRAAMYWQLREALDPATGDNLILPPDPELLADLCAAHFEVVASGIKVEPKDKIKERIGRSPDKGDACALSHLKIRPPDVSAYRDERLAAMVLPPMEVKNE